MVAIATEKRSTGQISAEERELRIQLAAGYRLADKYGMSELIYTHISMRVPGPTPAYLLNPYGMLFHEITASSLMKLDFAGNIAGPNEWPVNRAGVAIHGSILAARPDINCVFHTHMPYTTAVSALECGLLPMSQAALRFQGQTAYHDFGRAASDEAEGARLVKDVGDKPVMILRNHGGITTGKTVGKAFVASYYLEKACQFQLLAQSAGAPLVMPADENHRCIRWPPA
jgi:ribulose-5-phosphate 4-epimerase/fuculose-1-phosphate aldolase